MFPSLWGKTICTKINKKLQSFCNSCSSSSSSFWRRNWTSSPIFASLQPNSKRSSQKSLLFSSQNPFFFLFWIAQRIVRCEKRRKVMMKRWWKPGRERGRLILWSQKRESENQSWEWQRLLRTVKTMPFFQLQEFPLFMIDDVCCCFSCLHSLLPSSHLKYRLLWFLPWECGTEKLTTLSFYSFLLPPFTVHTT